MKLRVAVGSLACLAMLSLIGCQPRATTSAGGSDASPTPEGGRASVERPSADAYDIPRLDNINIDGDPGDWGDRGFRVEAMMHVGGPARAAGQFDPQFRIGWDDRGLLLLVSVRDTTHDEYEADHDIYRMDSMELFLSGDVGSANRYQIVISPGVDPKHPALRFEVIDHRPATDALPKIVPIQARTKTADGYIVEAVLPWAALGKSPKAGDRCGFNLIVNDYQAADKSLSHVGWFPSASSSSDPAAVFPLRLSDHADGPIRAAVSPAFSYFRRLDLAMMLRDREDGKPSRVSARDDRGELAQMTVEPAGGLHEAVLSVPMAYPLKPVGGVRVVIDGVEQLPQRLPDLDAVRAAVFQRIPFKFRDGVFAQTAFPAGDFEQPNLAQDLAGSYSVHTTYYDKDYNIVPFALKPGRYGAVSQITTAGGWTRTVYQTIFRSPGPVNWLDIQIEGGLFPRGLGLDPTTIGLHGKDLALFFKLRLFERQRPFEENVGTDASAVLLAGLSEDKPGEPGVDRNSAAARDERWWHPLLNKLQPTPYLYLADLPAGYDANPKARWPLIVYLHGSGERKGDLQAFASEPVIQKIAQMSGGRFIFVAPLCPDNQWWNPWKVADLLDALAAKYRVDPDRIYLTGYSLGGFGTWQTAYAMPERFAAVAPVAGIGDPMDAERIKDLPLWAFHGDKDNNVPFAWDKVGVDALLKIGGRAKFTVFPGVDHVSWNLAYGNKELYEWFLRQRRGQPDQPAAQGQP